MTLDLSLQSLVNSAGGLAFAAVGALALVLTRGAREGRLVGALALVFGVTYVVGNLWPFDTLPALLASGGGRLVMAALAVVATLRIARGLTRAGRRRLAIVALVLSTLTIVILVAASADLAGLGRVQQPAASGARAIYLGLGYASFFVADASLALFVAASALAYLETQASDERSRRALALQATAYGLFVAFAGAFVFPSPAVYNAHLAVPITIVLTWAVASREGGARGVTLALVGAALAGIALSLVVFKANVGATTDFGTPGVMRTAGAFLLARALLRHELAGPLPLGISARRGTLGAAALAALFIVAQIAQNFLTAQYGLLMGGLVAGALLVAARPIERALERRNAVPEGDKLEVYRDAARRSLRGGVVTREEERHLARVAHHMGISPDEALRIRHEVEDEIAARPSGRDP